MTSPVKSRSGRSSVSVDPRMGAVVNDNTPTVFPAHQLIGLDGLPRPPAAELVAHYARLTLIPSFPTAPDRSAASSDAAPDLDALPEKKEGGPRFTAKRTMAAGLCSLVFHAAVLAALTLAVVTLPEDPVEEAGDSVSVVMIGNGDEDQLAAGEEEAQPPKPDEVVAESVAPEAIRPVERETAEAAPVEPQPVETPPVDAQPLASPAAPVPEAVQPESVQPVQPVTQAAPQTSVSPEPEVLAAEVPAEPTVTQPMATEVQPEPMRPAAAPPAETPPEAVKPTEAVETPPPAETVTPLEKPTPPEKPVAKAKEVVRKPPPKAAKVKSGSKGESEQDIKKGSSEGTESAEANRSSQSAGSRQGSGSAAVANYPGKVQSRIHRSVRVPSQYRRMTEALTVRVRLTVDSGGQLSSLSLAHSSGIPELDNAVLEGVRRAAPFPPLPPEWGKPSWSFTQPVQVTGR